MKASGWTAGLLLVLLCCAPPSTRAVGSLNDDCPLPGYCKRTYREIDPKYYQIEPTDEALAKQKKIVDEYMRGEEYKNRVAAINNKHNDFAILLSADGTTVKNVIITLKLLRESYKVTAHVEVSHLDDASLDALTRAKLHELYGPVTFVDLAAQKYPAHHANVTGDLRYAQRLYHLYHSGFRNVLLLEMESVPLSDPTVVLQSPQWTQRGNLFWPDAWTGWANDDAYKLVGLRKEIAKPLLQDGGGFGRLLETDSSQVLLDRGRHADVLEYLWYMAAAQDKVWKLTAGDRETFRLAFALAGKAHEYMQLPLPPAAAFVRGRVCCQVEEKKKDAAGKDRENPRSEKGWQAWALVQYDHNGNQLFYRRSFSQPKWDTLLGSPQPPDVITGPTTQRFIRWYMDQEQYTYGQWKYTSGAAHSVPFEALHVLAYNPVPSNPAPEPEKSSANCSTSKLREYERVRRLGLPLETDEHLESTCRGVHGFWPAADAPRELRNALAAHGHKLLTFQRLQALPLDGDNHYRPGPNSAPALLLTADADTRVGVLFGGRLAQAFDWLEANRAQFSALQAQQQR